MKVYPSYLMIGMPSVLEGFLGISKTSFVRKRRLFPSINTRPLVFPLTDSRLFLQLHNSTTSILSKSFTSSSTSCPEKTIPTTPYPEDTITHFQRLHTNKLDLNLLLLDNYDSYTYNLYSYLSTICLRPPTVISNDAYDSWETLINNTCIVQDYDTGPQFSYDGIIISPGPGRPDRKDDIGICLEAIAKNINTPILGVCLGHQALGHMYNVPVTLAPCGPVHGLLSQVWYNNEYLNQDHHQQQQRWQQDSSSLTETQQSTWDFCDLFQGISQGFQVVRYHSLTVNFPSTFCWDNLDIEPIAWCIGDSRNDNTSELEDSQCNINTTSHSFTSLQSNPNAICMALRHKKYPHYGVQFHPESIGTGRDGYRLLENFCDFCFAWKTKNNKMKNVFSFPDGGLHTLINEKPLGKSHSTQSKTKDTEKSILGNSKYKVRIRKISSSQFKDSKAPSPQTVFEEFYEAMEASFWLDSSNGKIDSDNQFILDGIPSIMRKDDFCPIVTNSRFSILGGIDGPLSKRIEYYGIEHRKEKQGLFVWGKDAQGIFNQMTKHDETLLAFLQREMKNLNILEIVDGNHNQDLGYDNKIGIERNDITPPFKYRGGFVGYLGYEFRHDTRSSICDQEICKADKYSGSWTKSDNVDDVKRSNPNVPTAAFLFADRSLVYDHWRDDWYVVAVSLYDDTDHSSKYEILAREWIEDTCKRLQSMRLTDQHYIPIPPDRSAGNSTQHLHEFSKNQVNFELLRSQHQYEFDIARCLEEIKNGESYELCLTNKLSTIVTSNAGERSPFGLYKILRRVNPAPYSAYLNFGSRPSTTAGSTSTLGTLSICCSSPELFLSVSKGTIDTISESSTVYSSLPSNSKFLFTVESKPIKGTAPRKFADANSDADIQTLLESEQLRRSVKNRAENLMIVDLLRNDLSRVCEPGSVHVPKLMQVESFATVHQMVSTIRGIIDSSKMNAIDVISACFPGGSMTGAPKLRSVDILDGIEQGVSRGPYSGSLGYISFDGCMDLNIVIRTAILTPLLNSTNENNKSWDVSIGAGGAITALSEPDAEYDEMLLKARALIAAVNMWDDRH